MKRGTSNDLRGILPSPFSIAVILTVLCFGAAMLWTQGSGEQAHLSELIGYWQNGLWDLLAFGMQMMLMLVLGHSLALSPLIDSFISRLLSVVVRGQKEAVTAVCLLSLLAAFFNWGLGLILGAILVRKTAEFAAQRRIPINYGLLGAAGYTGMMVWHGGLSGSAPLTVAGSGHSLEKEMGLLSLEHTLFSGMNITAFAVCITLLPLFSWWMAKRFPSQEVPKLRKIREDVSVMKEAVGAEKLDQSPWFRWLLAALLLSAVIISWQASSGLTSYLNLNTINLILLTLAVSLHPNITSFLQSIERAINGASGILIQFPLYAGIMGIMHYSGLINEFAAFFIRISSENTFPQLALISAGTVNIMVPSGGGQWQVQGPILIQAARELGVPLGKTVMALSYGDQLTNMLQPFWALPLLGITGLKPSEIVKYCALYFLLGAIIFSGILWFF